jgi:hypothetical protein
MNSPLILEKLDEDESIVKEIFRKDEGSETFDQLNVRLSSFSDYSAAFVKKQSESLKIAWDLAPPGSPLRMPDYTYDISPIFESGKYSYYIEDTLSIYDAAYPFSLDLTFSENEIIRESLNILDNFDYESFTLVSSGKVSKITRADLPLSESKSKRKSTLDNKTYQNEKLNKKEMMDNKYMERMKIKINDS